MKAYVLCMDFGVVVNTWDIILEVYETFQADDPVADREVFLGTVPGPYPEAVKAGRRMMARWLLTTHTSSQPKGR